MSLTSTPCQLFYTLQIDSTPNNQALLGHENGVGKLLLLARGFNRSLQHLRRTRGMQRSRHQTRKAPDHIHCSLGTDIQVHSYDPQSPWQLCPVSRKSGRKNYFGPEAAVSPRSKLMTAYWR
jgi:hypothetical protein